MKKRTIKKLDRAIDKVSKNIRKGTVSTNLMPDTIIALAKLVKARAKH